MIDKTKQRIQELIPEIVELKFGCELLRKGETKYQVINPLGWGANPKKCWINSVPFGDIPLELEKDLVQNGGEFEILGSPITLAVVLRAIGIRPYEVNWYNANVITLVDEGNHFNWNLTKDNYDDQTEETKKFIGSLLLT